MGRSLGSICKHDQQLPWQNNISLPNANFVKKLKIIKKSPFLHFFCSYCNLLNRFYRKNKLRLARKRLKKKSEDHLFWSFFFFIFFRCAFGIVYSNNNSNSRRNLLKKVKEKTYYNFVYRLSSSMTHAQGGWSCDVLVTRSTSILLKSSN